MPNIIVQRDSLCLLRAGWLRKVFDDSLNV